MQGTGRSAQPGRPGNWGVRAGVAAASLAVALIVAEGAWRLHEWGPGALTPSGMRSIRPLGLSGLVQPSDTPGLRYELRPDVHEVFKLVPFDTNALGMRDAPVQLPKPEGVYRVAVIGDSFTMGSGVRIEEVYHSRLEDLLAQRHHRPFDFLNLGVGGYGLPDYVAVLRERALALEPDAVLLALNLTDRRIPSRPPDHGAWKPPPPRSGDYWTLHLFEGLLRALERWRNPEVLRAPDEQERRRAAAELRPFLAAMRDDCERASVPFAVAYLNIDPTPGARASGEIFGAVCTELGVPFLDTSPVFADRDFEELVIFANDAHPNAEAHALFARALAPFLSDAFEL